MKKAGKIAAIILIAAVVLYAIYLFSINLMLGSLFSDEHLTQEEIINTVNNNISLLNEAAYEIKNIDNTSFYVNASVKTEIDYISILLAPMYNRVLVSLIDNDLEKKNMSEMIKSETLFKILKIEGINAIERYYSDSGRICILFDCGSSGLSYYYGFYYTQDNEPIGWQGEDVSFKKYKNRWIWKDPEDFNRTYITEKITDNWFYFQMTD
jgi:hypothetical protein